MHKLKELSKELSDLFPSIQFEIQEYKHPYDSTVLLSISREYNPTGKVPWTTMFVEFFVTDCNYIVIPTGNYEYGPFETYSKISDVRSRIIDLIRQDDDIPYYPKSRWRHFIDWLKWMYHRMPPLYHTYY